MKKIPVAELEPVGRLSEPLYHESGAILFGRGAPIGEDEIGLLKLYGIKKVYALKPGNGFVGPTDLDFQVVALHDLTTPLAGPLYGDNGEVLVGPDAELTEPLRQEMLARGRHQLYALASPRQIPEQVRNFRKACHDFACFRSLEGIFKARLRDRLILHDPGVDLSPENLQRHLKEVRERDEPQGVALNDRLADVGLSEVRTEREASDGQALFELYQNLLAVLGDVFARLRQGDRARGDIIEELTRQLVVAFLRDRNLVLNLLNLHEQPDLLVEHSLHVTILCIGMALLLGYNEEQVRELAWAAVLHDVGMLRLPAELLHREGPVTAEEQALLESSPQRALEVLRLFDKVPQAAAVVAWQVGERPDGSGYPNGSKGEEISTYAHILKVADAYDAGIGDRPFARPQPAHDSLRQLVQLSARRQFDPRAARALLRCLSLYPVGTWVELEDERRGRVIGVNGSELARPVVRLLSRGDTPLKEPRTVSLQARPELRILRSLPVQPEPAELFLGF